MMPTRALLGIALAAFATPTKAQMGGCDLVKKAFKAGDANNDGYLTADEIPAALAFFSKKASKDLSYDYPDRLVAISDNGGYDQLEKAGDGRLELGEFDTGLHTLRHVGEACLPKPQPSNWCRHCDPRKAIKMAHVSDEYCKGTPMKDIWVTVYGDLCGVYGAADAPMWAAITFAGIIPLVWLIPCLFFCGWRACRKRGAATKTHDAQLTSNMTRTELLAVAEASAKRLRMRVSGTLMYFAWVLIWLAMIPMVLPSLAGKESLLAPAAGSSAWYITVLPWGLSLLVLALRPIDSRPIKFVCRFIFVFELSLAFLFLSRATNRMQNDNFNPGMLIGYYCGLAFFVIAAALLWPTLNISLRTAEPMPARLQLRQLWIALRIIQFGMAPVFLFFLLSPVFRTRPLVLTFNKGSNESAFLMNVLSWLAAAILFTPRVRGRVHRWLGSLGQSDSKEQEAASVAALISAKGSAADALAGAAEHFRAWPLGAITREVLQVNTPDPTLHKDTNQAKLGEVDAFVSHSWSDEGNAKYDRLYEYARQVANGRELGAIKLWFGALVGLDQEGCVLPFHLALAHTAFADPDRRRIDHLLRR